MSAIAFIIFGLFAWWVYYSVKHEGVYWIPKFFLALGVFVSFFWGITFIFPYVYELFIKSTSIVQDFTVKTIRLHLPLKRLL